MERSLTELNMEPSHGAKILEPQGYIGIRRLRTHHGASRSGALTELNMESSRAVKILDSGYG